MKLTTFLLFIAILFCTDLQAQSKKGLKLIKKKKYEEAEAAFRKDLAHPYKGVAARYGMSLSYSSQRSNMPRFKKSYDWAIDAKETWEKLDAKSQKKLKKYDVTQRKLTAQMVSIQRKALRLVDRENDLFLLDTFMLTFSPVDKRLSKQFSKSRQKIVREAIRNHSDYATLTSLAKNHYEIAIKDNYKFQRTLQRRLFNTFIDEFGFPATATFVKDHPKHSFSIDCWVEEFIEACQDGSGVNMINFLKDYPLSTLDVHASSVLYDQTKSGRRLPEASKLSQTEQDQLEAVLLEWQLEKMLSGKSPSAKFHQKLLTSIRQNAPSRRAYLLMKDVLQRYFEAKAWDKALDLINYCEPLFPDEQPKGCYTRYFYYSTKEKWFSIAVPIIKAAATGIELKPVEEVNSLEGEEFSPLISADGLTLYFAATNRKGQVGGEDIFAARYALSKQVWAEPEIVKSLSTDANEVPLSITSDGNQLLLFRDGKLHISHLGPLGWDKARPLPEAINAFPWIGRASMSRNGKVILFSASKDPEEIYGESNVDIYVSEKDSSGVWSKPQKLGRNINTIRQERSPTLHADGKTLYFSSNSDNSLGGMDVFMAKRLDDSWINWSEPINLGKEINSLEDDWGYNFSINSQGQVVYLSSVDPDSYRNKIFASGLPSFATPEKLTPLNITVKRDRVLPSNTHLVAALQDGTVIDRAKVRPDGSTTIIAPQDSTIIYYLDNPMLFPSIGIIDLSKINGDSILLATDSLQAVYMKDMLENNKAVPLDHVVFEQGQVALKPIAFDELNTFYKMLQIRNWSIEIGGHTDNEGGDAFNKQLSLQRAELVRNYLQGLGYPTEKMEVKGYGFDQPIADNDTEDGQAKNRRVEIKIKPEN